MKSLSVAIVCIAISALSCTKSTPLTPTYPLAGSGWTNAADTAFHLSFTSDSMTFRHPALEPNPSTVYYTSLTRDTLAAPAMSAKFTAVVTKDSLHFRNVASTQVMHFYRN